ncbi:VanZ family protein [Nocardioides sp. Kera G14]|uniref:VanZ family protein n=1 Tax=Nocardioides sp. Kera G14 TaxID=2884264 RepID=UPI001D1106E9|nr:VanZ family protein [Nocardioides sp. Kera G14]UDY23820.1 VanZ family protein [Nocardioides sp. Kera G14]
MNQRTTLLVLVLLAAEALGFVACETIPSTMPRLERWHYWLGTSTGVVELALLAVPVSLLAIALLAWHRRGWRTAVADVAMIHGTLPSLVLTMKPGSHAGEVAGRTSFVPFQDMVTTGPVEIVGNLLLLAALGFFAPIRWSSVSTLPRVLGLAAGCSALIETAQYVLRLDRVTSVDDVILNTTGACVAALLSRPWWRRRPRPVAAQPVSPKTAAIR